MENSPERSATATGASAATPPSHAEAGPANGTGKGANQRLVSLDAFRGITMAMMVLVNTPGSPDHTYAQLLHAEWNGCTFTDWVFPFFLYIVGVSITFALERQTQSRAEHGAVIRKIAKRALTIYLIGLFLNGFPTFKLATYRFLGVLPRIAICYFVAAIITLRCSLRQQIAWIVGLLATYWLTMKLVPVPGVGAGVIEPGQNLSNHIDRMIIPAGHMWRETVTWDPEGFLSTLPAIATTLFGVLAGRFIRTDKTPGDKAAWMFTAGLLLVGAGLAASFWLPLNKKIWTSSYCLYTAGWATTMLALCFWLVDAQGIRRWARPFIILGSNAIAIYAASEMLDSLLWTITVTGAGGTAVPVRTVIYDALFAPLASPMNASLLFALCYVGLMYLLALWLYRKKWFLKV